MLSLNFRERKGAEMKSTIGDPKLARIKREYEERKTELAIQEAELKKLKEDLIKEGINSVTEAKEKIEELEAKISEQESYKQAIIRKIEAWLIEAEGNN